MVEIGASVNKASHPQDEASKPANDFSCLVTCGLVLRMELDDIPKLIRYARKLQNSQIIYHTKSLGHLRIVKE